MFQRFFKISLIITLVLLLLLPSSVVFSQDSPEEEEEEFTPTTLMPFNVEAKAAILVEAETGNVLYAKNPDEPMPPASIVKMMTLLLAFEALESGQADWDDIAVTSEKAWRDTRGNVSQIYLNVGQEVTYRELIEGISIVSANDASIVLAEFLAGSETAFVNRMNQRAQELGMTNTRFRNSHGLPAEGQEYMSARDIALLAQVIVNNQPKILEFDSRPEYTFNNIRQDNFNKLPRRYPGADGIKTGSTTAAGYSLAGTAKPDDVRLLSVVLNTESDAARLNITTQLLDYGFHNFTREEVFSPGDIVDTIPIKGGKEREIEITVSSPLKAMVPINERDAVEIVKNMEEAPAAPIAKGDTLGTVQVVMDDIVMSETYLVAAEDVARANIFTRAFRFVGDFFSNLIKGIGRSD